MCRTRQETRRTRAHPPGRALVRSDKVPAGKKRNERMAGGRRSSHGVQCGVRHRLERVRRRATLQRDTADTRRLQMVGRNIRCKRPVGSMRRRACEARLMRCAATRRRALMHSCVIRGAFAGVSDTNGRPYPTARLRREAPAQQHSVEHKLDVDKCFVPFRRRGVR